MGAGSCFGKSLALYSRDSIFSKGSCIRRSFFSVMPVSAADEARPDLTEEIMKTCRLTHIVVSLVAAAPLAQGRRRSKKPVAMARSSLAPFESIMLNVELTI